MASKLHNLSDYNKEAMPEEEFVSKQHYAVVVSDWNSDITFALLEGCLEALEQNGVTSVEVVHVPGAFELTYAAKELQAMDKYQAVIALGCVIQGDTPHFDYICQGVSHGISMLNSRDNRAPVIFGVLTVLNKQQALDRCGGALGNKGVEAAVTAIKMANVFRFLE